MHRTGVITTVAGDGQLGGRGDAGPAVAASLGGPASLALVSEGRKGDALDCRVLQWERARGRSERQGLRPGRARAILGTLAPGLP